MKAVVIYADESGTHDKTGTQKGSAHPLIAGFAAPPSDWAKFCVDWKAVLDAYNAPYFHFREWTLAANAIRFNRKETPELSRNPFHKWELKRLEKFLLALARIAGSGNKVLITGGVHLPAFKVKRAAAKTAGVEFDPNPYKHCMEQFFRSCHDEMAANWGNFKSPVTFFFDQQNDPSWRATVRGVYEAFKAKDSRMQGISFVDKKQKPHWPLQAADLLAYRMRQISQKTDEKAYDIGWMDETLFGNLAVKAKRRFSPMLPQSTAQL